ncbi:MAG TPA: hypothetical protein VLA24_17415, partial [Pseudomonadales bacterium]|nr:hypothetical protein [Pseudomonadales bacterium]
MSTNNTPEKINAVLIEHANEVGRTCLETCSNCANRHLANYRITDAEQERVPNGIRVWVTCADATQYHVDV